MNLSDEVSYNHSVKKKFLCCYLVAALWWRESCLKLCSSGCVLVRMQVYAQTASARLEKYTNCYVTIMQKNLGKILMLLCFQREKNGTYMGYGWTGHMWRVTVLWRNEKLFSVNCLFSICSFCCCMKALPRCWTE